MDAKTIKDLREQVKQTLCCDCKGVAESLEWVCWQNCEEFTKEYAKVEAEWIAEKPLTPAQIRSVQAIARIKQIIADLDKAVEEME